LHPDEALIVDVRLRELTAIGLAVLLDASERAEPYDGWALARVGELLEQLLRTAGAAVLVDDPAVFVCFADWSAIYLGHRGEHAAVLAAALVAVASECGPELPETGRILRLAADSLD